MRGGDLSNEFAPIIAIRFERVLRTEDGKLNRAGRAYLHNLFREADCNIYIITTGNPRKAMAFSVKWGIPYAHVVQVDSTLEIPLVCMEAGASIYWDADSEIVDNVRGRAGHITNAKVFEHLEVA